MTDVAIREAKPDDLDDIQRVAERGWNAAYGEHLSRETIETALSTWYADEPTLAAIERDDLAYFVADRDGAVVGYVSGRSGAADVVEAPGGTESVATLDAIYVDPDHWGEGIGTALLDEFEAWCGRRGVDVVTIRVLAENRIGVAFYGSHGYESIDECDVELFGEAVRERVFRGRIE